MPEHDLNTAADALVALMDAEPEDEPKEPEAKVAEIEPDEPADEPEDEPAEPAKLEAKVEEEPEFEVTIDGAKVKVKQTELLNGYQRQADYTRKTGEIAQQRQQIEQQLTQRTNEYAQGLQTLMQQMQTAVQAGQLAPPDPSLLDTNPHEYLKQDFRWKQAQQSYQTAAAQTEQLRAQEVQAQQQRLQTHLATEREQLLAKLPTWKDETRMLAERRELTDYLVKAGYRPEEVSSTADHRAVVLAHKAMQYDKLVAEQKAIVKNKVPAAQPKTAKPGVASDEVNPLNKSAMQRLRKTGSADDAVAAIASLMGD